MDETFLHRVVKPFGMENSQHLADLAYRISSTVGQVAQEAQSGTSAF